MKDGLDALVDIESFVFYDMTLLLDGLRLLKSYDEIQYFVMVLNNKLKSSLILETKKIP